MAVNPSNRSTDFNPAPQPMRDLVAEALAKQAKLRPLPTPPKEMPVTPTLPRMPKPHKRRRGM